MFIWATASSAYVVFPTLFYVLVHVTWDMKDDWLLAWPFLEPRNDDRSWFFGISVGHRSGEPASECLSVTMIGISLLATSLPLILLNRALT